MGLVSSDDGWRLPEWLWERVALLLPAAPSHPLGCHRPRAKPFGSSQQSGESCPPWLNPH